MRLMCRNFITKTSSYTYLSFFHDLEICIMRRSQGTGVIMKSHQGSHICKRDCRELSVTGHESTGLVTVVLDELGFHWVGKSGNGR